MNTQQLRRPRVLVPAVALVAALGVGGVVWATTASADVSGSERDRVAAAATRAVGGGTATDVETSDDRGEAYEVEVRRPDGTDVDVALDQDLRVVGRDSDAADSTDAADASDASGSAGSTDQTGDPDDRRLSATERRSAEKAALEAIGGGRVTDVEASDDPGEAYDVEAVDRRGTEWDLDLDASFGVLHKVVDR